MGRVEARWCFHGIGPKGDLEPYCAVGKIDTGATMPVIPQKEARRLGILLRTITREPMPEHPTDASGRLLDGAWYMLGAMRADGKKNCYVDPICVFGQKGRSEPIIGAIPLQAVGTTIELRERGDSFTCDRPSALRSVGAAVNLVREAERQIALIKKFSR